MEHNYRVGSHSGTWDDLPTDPHELDSLINGARKHIESWLLANDHLNALSPRYRLARRTVSDLALHIVDRDMGDEVRGTRSLPGGERFLVSLALALALSGLERRSSFVDTLFIDEGFGSLDTDTLDLAVDALETLQGRRQKVGVITHVAAMIERIAVQVRVDKCGAGRSETRISTEMGTMWPAIGTVQRRIDSSA